MSTFQPVTALGAPTLTDARRRSRFRWRATERLLTGVIGAGVLAAAIYLGANAPLTSPVAPPAPVTVAAAGSNSTVGSNVDGSTIDTAGGTDTGHHHDGGGHH